MADAEAFLGGKGSGVQAKLAGAMQQASEGMDYELAAIFRDRLKALTFVQTSQAINGEGLEDADVFALAAHGGAMCIQAFFIRGGQNCGSHLIFPVHTAEVDEDEVLASFLGQFYEDTPPPPVLLLDRQLGEAGLISEALLGQGWAQGEDRGAPARPQDEADRTGAAQCRRSTATATGGKRQPG